MVVELKYRMTYEGGEADHNRLPAHDGGTSIEGLTWTFSLLAHYGATGKIKARGEMSSKVQVFLSPARSGSYLYDLYVHLIEPENLFITSIAGSYTAATVGQVLNSLIGSSLKSVCGLAVDLVTGPDKKLLKLPSGDREALIDKIEPSMRRAHNVIGGGVKTLTVKKGYTPLVQMDLNTKAYVNADLLTDEVSIVAGVRAYHADTGNGSVYLSDVGKTVPIFAKKGLNPGTYAALSYSLDRYVNNLPNDIEIACRQNVAIDGRTKRLLIQAAFKPSH